MQKPALVVMAAGLGSRYGGLKQIERVDENGHLLIDYSIFDARKAGFETVVCVITPDMQSDFHEAIGARIEPFLDLRYAFQRMEALPQGYAVPEGRAKPWGTAHAVLCAREAIGGPFAVINADDFYGRSAIASVYGFLSRRRLPTQHAMVGYRIENTLTENGKVARGVCAVRDGFLIGITERTHVVPAPGGAQFMEERGRFTYLPGDTIVSMNLWGFQRSMLDEIAHRFQPFLDHALEEGNHAAEFYLPSVPDALLREGKATVRVLPTQEKWFGVTYREDMPRVKAAIAEMKKQGIYPNYLWRDA